MEMMTDNLEKMIDLASRLDNIITDNLRRNNIKKQGIVLNFKWKALST